MESSQAAAISNQQETDDGFQNDTDVALINSVTDRQLPHGLPVTADDEQQVNSQFNRLKADVNNADAFVNKAEQDAADIEAARNVESHGQGLGFVENPVNLILSNYNVANFQHYFGGIVAVPGKGNALLMTANAKYDAPSAQFQFRIGSTSLGDASWKTAAEEKLNEASSAALAATLAQVELSALVADSLYKQARDNGKGVLELSGASFVTSFILPTVAQKPKIQDMSDDQQLDFAKIYNNVKLAPRSRRAPGAYAKLVEPQQLFDSVNQSVTLDASELIAGNIFLNLSTALADQLVPLFKFVDERIKATPQSSLSAFRAWSSAKILGAANLSKIDTEHRTLDQLH